MNDIKMKLEGAIKIHGTSGRRSLRESFVSFSGNVVRFSHYLLECINVPTKLRCGLNVYVNKKYNVMIFEFCKDVNDGAITHNPKNGVSLKCIQNLLSELNYPIIPMGRLIPSGFSRDLETDKSYVELPIPGVSK